MFIGDGIAYIRVSFPTDEEVESLPKALLTPPGEWKPSYIEDDGQWEDSDDGVSIFYRVSATISSQDIHILEPILSAT